MAYEDYEGYLLYFPKHCSKSFSDYALKEDAIQAVAWHHFLRGWSDRAVQGLPWGRAAVQWCRQQS